MTKARDRKQLALAMSQALTAERNGDYRLALQWHQTVQQLQEKMDASR